MSPAPQRVRKVDPYQSFPHSWGYGLGVLLMVLGIGLAIFLVVDGIRGFTDDVRGLRRDVQDLELGLEEGEYLVFDEDGLDLGPFSAKVTRTSDGREIPTRRLDDGTTYDVDGRTGQAKLSFDVPTSDIYRIELDTSVGEVARFAVGSDVGNDRANAITRGILFGSVLLGLGFVAIVVTLIQHARWRLRTEVDRGASRARDAVAQVVDLAEGSAPTPPPAERAALWGRDRLDQAREAVAAAAGESGESSAARDGLADQATAALRQVEGQLDAVEPVVAEVAEAAPGPADLAARIDEALGRVQGRVASGDRLRDIARDETTQAAETVAEMTEQAKAARQLAVDGVATLDEATPAPPPPDIAAEVPVNVAADMPTEQTAEAPPTEMAPESSAGRLSSIQPSPVASISPPPVSRTVSDGFAALAPPPQAQPIRVAPVVANREPEVSTGEVDIEAEPEETEPPPTPPRAGFSLAPPPDYSTLDKR